MRRVKRPRRTKAQGRSGENTPWVFVSHASADLEKVRQIRNIIEECGGAPLLFHLKSLSDEAKFWPLIEQEIRSRNFFLLCDSKAARASPWVQREREAVKQAARQRPIRVGRVSLDGEVDFFAIEKFLANLHVFMIHPKDHFDLGVPVTVFQEFGYNWTGSVAFSAKGLDDLKEHWDANFDLLHGMEQHARHGWVVIFLDRVLATSETFGFALPEFVDGRVLFAALDRDVDMTKFRKAAIPGAVIVEGLDGLETIARAAASKMLVARSDSI